MEKKDAILEDRKKKVPKNNIIKLILLIIGLIIAFEIVLQVLSPYLTRILWYSIFNGKYGIYFMTELSALIMVMIIVIIRKKWYIFKNAQVSFWKAVKLSGPILFITIFYFILNTIQVFDTIRLENLISLALFSLTIGFLEEIFYRGIIQNEILPKHSKNRKEVITSIIICAFIFGMSHITNFIVGQGLFTTILQVFQTTAIGLIFCSVYYLTKNIWAVIFLHSTYDFALLISEVSLLKDCTYADVAPFNIAMQTACISAVLIIIYVAYTYSLLQKSNFDILIDHKETLEKEKREEKIKKEKVITASIIIVVILGAVGFAFSTGDYDGYYTCYLYDDVTIERYETHYFKNDRYNISVINNNIAVNFDVYLDNNIIKIKDMYTNEIVTLNGENILSLTVYEDEGIYKILALGIDNGDYKVYYSEFINFNMEFTNNALEELSNSFKEYIVPNASGIGYLYDLDKLKKYPMIVMQTNQLLILNDGEIYSVNMD